MVSIPDTASDDREMVRLTETTVTIPATLVAVDTDAVEERVQTAARRAAQDLMEAGRFTVPVSRGRQRPPVVRVRLTIPVDVLRLVRRAAARHHTTISGVVAAYMDVSQSQQPEPCPREAPGFA